MTATPNGQLMPKFTATHNVHAAKIASVEPIKGHKGKSLLTFQDGFYTPAEIDSADIVTVDGKDPKPGDYYVVAPDETYYQDAAEFEAEWKAA